MSAGAGPVSVALIGPGECDEATSAAAEEVGRLVALRRAVLVCGGLGGVMAAGCRGARSAGGTTVGLLPGTSRAEANPWVSVAVPTGLGELRNGLVVRAADVVLALGAGFGTLSEIAFALKLGRPVVGLHTWGLLRPGGDPDRSVHRAGDPVGAVALAFALALGPPRPPGGPPPP